MESFHEIGQSCFEKNTPRKRETFVFIRHDSGTKRDIRFVLTRKEASHTVTDSLSSREEEFAIHPAQTTIQWRAVLSVGRSVYDHTHTSPAALLTTCAFDTLGSILAVLYQIDVFLGA